MTHTLYTALPIELPRHIYRLSRSGNAWAEFHVSIERKAKLF